MWKSVCPPFASIGCGRTGPCGKRGVRASLLHRGEFCTLSTDFCTALLWKEKNVGFSGKYVQKKKNIYRLFMFFVISSMAFCSAGSLASFCSIFSIECIAVVWCCPIKRPISGRESSVSWRIR